MEALKEGQIAIEKDLEAIKDFLRGRQAAPPPEPQDVVLSFKDHPFKGDKNAKVAFIEFSDYQCPFCARYFRETLPQIEKDYIQTGKIKYGFRHFPIESIHPEAFKASEAANCAADQGKYWEMHDRLFAHPDALGLKDLSEHAQALKIDLPSFQQCLESGKKATEVRKDIADGMKAGVRGTPTFFLALVEPNESKIKALRMITGAQPYSSFKEAIDSLLSAQK
ncbi:MAG: DsbA family protein [Acidobacteria bacterium]|nr:DsbA family protein [Acidobacteriota bacterium]